MDEKMRILKMVEDGKISAEQAIDLLNAMGEADQTEANANTSAANWPAASAQGASYDNKMLRIIVDSPNGDNVNVKLPVKIIRQVLKVTGKLPIQTEGMQGIDLDALAVSILECLDNETLGDIVNVNGADGTTVKIFIG